MERLLQWSKCSIFHNIFKYKVFQMCQNELSWSKGLIFIYCIFDKYQNLMSCPKYTQKLHNDEDNKDI